MGYEIVLTSDRTLMSEYRHIPLADFAGCAPIERFPEVLFKWLAPAIPHKDGVVVRAPYSLRKVEASLYPKHKNKIVVAHPDYIERFVDDETKLIGVSAMDPFGLGPVSMIFTWGGGEANYKSFTSVYFNRLIHKINEIRKRYRAKLIVGGGGAWQFIYRKNYVYENNIDHIVLGEVEHVAEELFQEVVNETASTYINIRSWPKPEEIPSIINPSIHGLVEVMRGCGRGCRFCEPNIRIARYIPIKTILREVHINTIAELKSIWVHSDDIFLYRLEDRRTFYPNRDALIDLFRQIMSVKGVFHANPTHGSIAPVVADPIMLMKLSEVLNAGSSNWIGIQPGIETASSTLLKRYMPNKPKPFSADEWSEIVIEGTKIFNENYWFPAYTLIMGLPGETEDDVWRTVSLIDRMERELPEKVGAKAHFVVVPLSFVPTGVLRGEEFFNPEFFDESRYTLLYRCWRHNFMEIKNLRFIKTNFLVKYSLYVLLKILTPIIMNRLKLLGRKTGYEPMKVK